MKHISKITTVIHELEIDRVREITKVIGITALMSGAGGSIASKNINPLFVGIGGVVGAYITKNSIEKKINKEYEKNIVREAYKQKSDDC
ncbi:MAG: hypothetical protein WC781_00210 [Candidatus Pacearchaeota archaeon]|jgi:hypothetical protein